MTTSDSIWCKAFNSLTKVKRDIKEASVQTFKNALDLAPLQDKLNLHCYPIQGRKNSLIHIICCGKKGPS